jgi:hypothetical protein
MWRMAFGSVKSTGFGARVPGFEFWLCYLSWASDLISLGSIFHICKRGRVVIVVSASEDYCED